MKRFSALFMAVIMVFCISACRKDAVLSEVSSDVSSESKDYTVKVEDVIPQSSTVDTVSSVQETQSVASEKPKLPVHKHSYTKKVTPPTCTEKGYTTYTCSCGDTYKSDYVNPVHSYADYVCTRCGAIDKAHSFEYLISWVKKNGQVYGTDVKCIQTDNGIQYGISYSEQNDFLYVFDIEFDGEFNLYGGLYLDTFFYYVAYGDRYDNYNELTGYLKPAEFTRSSPIEYEEYEGSEDLKYDYIEISRQKICEVLDYLKKFLDERNVGITMADLGFSKY